MNIAIRVDDLTKVYKPHFTALSQVNLEVHKGEILALLGPNGAGKTTLIGSICGLVSPTEGHIEVGGYDAIKDYKKARELIGLVPQELTTDAFETVWDSVNFTRGLFGKKPAPHYIEQLLKDLHLWEKRKSKLMTLSGGMKRRVMIAKALSHEPEILFLDEPTAGVDVELRKSMWDQVRKLRERGVTIILTTHYIDEAEEMADRIGIINHGKLLFIEEKTALMKKLGKKELTLDLHEPLSTLPESLMNLGLSRSEDGQRLTYTYDSQKAESGITHLLELLAANNIQFKDLHTTQSSLEEIFVQLVRKQ